MIETHSLMVGAFSSLVSRFRKYPFSFYNEQDCRAYLYQYLIENNPGLNEIESGTCRLHLEYPIYKGKKKDGAIEVSRAGKFDLVILKSQSIARCQNVYNLSRPSKTRPVDFSGMPFESICEIKFLYKGTGRSNDVVKDFKRMHEIIDRGITENAYVIYLQRMLGPKESYNSAYKSWIESKAVAQINGASLVNVKNLHHLYFAVFCDKTGKAEPFREGHLKTNLDIKTV